MNETLRALPDRRVSLLPGLFKKRFEVNRQYVFSLKSHNLLQNHYMEAGLWAPIGKPETHIGDGNRPPARSAGSSWGTGFPPRPIFMPAPATPS